MSSLGDLTAETQLYIGDFDRVLGFAEICIERSFTLCHIFVRLRASLIRPPGTSLADQFSVQSETCTLGCKLEQFQILFQLADSLIRFSSTYGSVIDDLIIPTINHITSSGRAAVALWQDKVEASFAAEQAAVSAVRVSEQQLQALHSKLQNAGPKASFSMVRKYVAGVRGHRRLVADLNQRHKDLVDFARTAIDALKSMLISRESQIKSLLFQLSPILTQIIDECNCAKNLLTAKRPDWPTGFRSFLASNGIVRRSVANQEFKVFQFPFENELITEPVVGPTAPDLVVPTAIGIVRAAFEGREECELSVQRGDRLYLIEQWQPKIWLFAVTPNRRQYGFVPSDIIEVIDARTVFTKAARLAMTPEQSTFRSGELMIVKSEVEGVVICEAADGTEKTVSADNLC
jgi:hypothetical protein